jgi:hypothetical protein
MFGDFVIRLTSLPQSLPQFPCPWCLTALACLPAPLGGPLQAMACSSLLLIIAICFKRRVAPFDRPLVSILIVAVAVVLCLLHRYTHCLYLALVTHLSCASRFLLNNRRSIRYRHIYLQTKHILRDHRCTRLNCMTFTKSTKRSETRFSACATRRIRPDTDSRSIYAISNHYCGRRRALAFHRLAC